MDNIQKTRQLLTDSIFEVFEKMFYLFLEPRDNDKGDYRYETSMQFSGPIQGELTALFSRSLAEEMAKNMLSVADDEITEELMEDCLKESVNVMCGAFLRKYAPSQTFSLSIPRVAPCRAKSGSGESAAAGQKMHLGFVNGEDGLMVVMALPEMMTQGE